MQRIIEVTVSPQGETKVQTKGFQGGDCLEASKFLETALGIPTSDKKTGEFFGTAENQQQVQQ
jgi:hypothetical protein